KVGLRAARPSWVFSATLSDSMVSSTANCCSSRLASSSPRLSCSSTRSGTFASRVCSWSFISWVSMVSNSCCNRFCLFPEAAACGSGLRGVAGTACSDLADQVQRRLQRFFAGLPGRGADFAVVFGHVLGCLDLAQQLFGSASDTKVVYFHHLDLAFRVDHEGAAQGEAFLFDQHAEVFGNAAGRVGDHREADLLDGRRAVMPRLVREVCVGGDRIDFHTQFLEFLVVVRKIFKFRRADEGEVGRVEENHAPLALEVGFGDGDVLAVVVGSGLEGLDLGVDQCAHVALLVRGWWPFGPVLMSRTILGISGQ